MKTIENFIMETNAMIEEAKKIALSDGAGSFVVDGVELYTTVVTLEGGKTGFEIVLDGVVVYEEAIELNKIEEVEKMENVKTVVLKGTEEVVSIIGLQGNFALGMKLIDALNESGILAESIGENFEVRASHEWDSCFIVGGNEYLVIEGEENADNVAIEYVKNVFSDCGLSEDLLNIADQQGLIDEEWFKDAWNELHENIAWNEDIEYIADDEQLEQLEQGIITEDDIREGHEKSLNDSIAGQEMMEYRYQFGDDNFYNVVKEKELINFDALAKYCVECDGRGHSLSSYDGEEIQEGELFIYRVN